MIDEKSEPSRFPSTPDSHLILPGLIHFHTQRLIDPELIAGLVAGTLSLHLRIHSLESGMDHL